MVVYSCVRGSVSARDGSGAPLVTCPAPWKTLGAHRKLVPSEHSHDRFLPGGLGVGVLPSLPKSMKPRFGFVERSWTSISSPTSTPPLPRTSIPSTGGLTTLTH